MAKARGKTQAEAMGGGNRSRLRPLQELTGVRAEAMEDGDRGLAWAMGGRNDGLASTRGTRKGDLARAMGRRGEHAWVTGGGAWPRVQEGPGGSSAG